MNKKRVVYFGTPDFSANLLDVLLRNQTENNYEIVGVVTTPDSLVGRKQILTKTPVKMLAEQYEAPVFDFDMRLDRAKTIHLIKDFRADIAILFAYGKIIPIDIIKSFPMGIWNIHPSDLPYFRGASPIAYPMMFGISDSFVSLMKMDEKMDHGEIISKSGLYFGNDEIRSDIENKIAGIAFEMIKISINNLSNITFNPQNHDKATFTKLLKRDDGFIPFEILLKTISGESLNYDELPPIMKDYLEKYGEKHGENMSWFSSAINSKSQPSEHKEYLFKPKIIYDFWRAMMPWPGLWTICESAIDVGWSKVIGKRIKIIEIGWENDRVTISKIQIEGERVKVDDMFILR